MNDRHRWNTKYRDEMQHARVNPNLIHYAPRLSAGRVLDLAGGMGQNGAWLAAFSSAFRVIDADASDVALERASAEIARVVADAGALPFAPHCFDTILNFRFYEPSVIFADWLVPGGTVLFETFTQGDAKYRPDFSPAHRFALEDVARVFGGLDILEQKETDDGRRVYVTILARKSVDTQS